MELEYHKNDKNYYISCLPEFDLVVATELIAAKIPFEYCPESINSESGFTIEETDSSKQDLSSCLDRAKGNHN